MNISELLSSNDPETILLGIKLIPFVKFYRYIKSSKPIAYKAILLLLRHRNHLEFLYQPFNEYYSVRINMNNFIGFPISVPYLNQLYQQFENENI